MTCSLNTVLIRVMNLMQLKVFSSILIFLLFLLAASRFSPSTLAGNPVVTSLGAKVLWPADNFPVKFHIDPGPAGSFSSQFLQQLTIKAFQNWSQLKYSELSFEFGGLMKFDVTAENIDRVLGNIGDQMNPIIFDSDGSISDLLLGQNGSDSVLAFSSLNQDKRGEIQEASIILNGKLINGENGDINRTFSTLLHEVGHFAGLDHTQIHTEFAFDDDASNNIFLPIMLPIETQDFESPTQLSLDDELTLSSNYPTDRFFLGLWPVFGSVKRPDGTPVQGANVVAVNVNEPLVSRFATVSDLFITQTGEFAFEGLPPGEYEFFVEPIHSDFWGISSVGPFAETQNSESFIDPIPFEYYNGERESGSLLLDDPMDRVTIKVGEGEEIPNIEFITNEDATPISEWNFY